MGRIKIKVNNKKKIFITRLQWFVIQMSNEIKQQNICKAFDISGREPLMQLSKICVILIILINLFQISQNQTAASFGPSGYFDIRSQTLTLSSSETSPYTFEFLTNIGPSSLAHRSPFYTIHYADQIIFDTTSKSVYLVSRISSIGATSFRVQFQFKTASGGSFYSLASSSLYKLMYMIIDPSFSLAYLSCLLSLVTTETVVTNAGLTFTNSVSSIAGSSVITLSASDTQYFYSLISFEVINTSANQNGASIKLMFSTTDANNFQIRLNYVAPESIKDLKICLFIYNKTPYVSASLQVKSGFGSGSLLNNVVDYGYGLSWSSYTNAFAIYGMSGLELQTSQRFGFDFAITMTTGVSIMVRCKNLIITSYVPILQFNLMSVAGLYCSSSSTYFNSANSQCYPCHQTCATCFGGSATQCKSCNAAQHRTLVNSSCLPMSGYYDDGTNAAAQPCDTSVCVECSMHATNCTLCSSTKFYTPYTCTQCTWPCATCSSATACLTCSSGLTLVGTTCPCANGQYPDSQSQSCTQCSNTLPHCTACTSTPACTQCETGYFVDNQACTQCSASLSNCINCNAGPVCTLCTTGYYINNGSCVACMLGCISCSSANTCSSCNVGITLSNGKCTCNSGNYIDPTGTSCVTCPSACVTCSSGTVCLTCVSYKYLSASNWCENCHSTCLTCNGGLNSNCVTCDEVTRTFSSGSCVCKTGAEDTNGNCITPVTPVTPAITCNDVKCNSCPSDANICTQCKSTLILSGNTCTCPSTSYYSAGNTACYACHGTCATCSGPSSTQCLSCLSTQNRQLNSGTSSCDCKPNFTSSNSQLVCSGTCSSGYSYNTSSLQCEQICGDGLLFDLQCDDGNSDAGDGCDSTCKIETGYSCVNGSQTSPSICSYNGPINFTLIEAKKEQYSNTVNMKYKLSPQLKLYSQYPNFTSYLSASDPVFTINQALYSLDQKRLRLSFSYNQSIMSRTLSIAYSPPSGLVSVQASSFQWSPSVQNGFSLNYYENSTYKTARNLSHLAMGSNILGLIIFIFGLLFRKMIGIQIILLIQAEILSIVMLKDLHPYFVGLTMNNYVFGYNGLYDSLGTKTTVSFQNDSPIFSTIGFSPIFGQNVNIMVFFVLGLYVLSTFIGIFSKCANKQTANGMKQASLIIARQIAFGTIVFSTLNIMASYIIEVNQSKIMKNLAQLSGILKIMSIILILMNYIIYAISYKQSTESTKFYRRQSKISKLQPLFIYSKAIIIAILITLQYKLGPITFYILLIIQLIYLVLIIILRPFRRKLDLARSIIIELAMTYIFVIRWLLRLYVNLENPGKWKGFSEFAIVTEYGLVAVAVLISGIDLVYHFVKASKYDSQVHPEPSQIGGQVGGQNESHVEKGSQKHDEKHDQNSTNPSIKFYLEKQITKKYKTPHRNKLYTEKQNNNASMAQLIQFSNDDLEDQIGYESKRKLKDKQIPDTYDNVDYNQKNLSNNRRKRKEKQRGDKYYGDLEIVEMDD